MFNKDEKYTATIVKWFTNLAAPLRAPLSGDNEPLLSHPSKYGPLSDRIESFSRPLLAVSPLLSNSSVIDLPGAEGFVSAIHKTLLKGTDPDSPDYWGKMQDIYQPVCETSAIAWCLHNAREILWDPLGKKERDQIATWLADVQEKVVSDSNWHLFPAVTAAFLRQESYSMNEEEMRGHINRVFNDFYCGRGWYQDGSESAIDSYNGNQIQPYMQMLDELGALTNEQSVTVKKRSIEWIDTMLQLFDEEGVAPFWGRSGLYRWNFLDGVGMAFRRGLPVNNPGDWRRIAAGCCCYFDIKAITSKDGYLLSGFLGKKEDVLDWYSVRASAYWVGRNAHFMQIDKTSPFWSEEPRTWQEGLVHFAPIPLAAHRRKRHVVAWNLGISHRGYSTNKYHNLLWSGRFAQAYQSGAAALRYKDGSDWKIFAPWKCTETGENTAVVTGKVEDHTLKIVFKALHDGGNEITITNTGRENIELRLGGFSVSGDIESIPNGLKGVEGISILRLLSGFTRTEAEGNDGTHLWASDFRYPVGEADLAPGESAKTVIKGDPGNWSEVLKLYGGEKSEQL